MTWVGLEGAAGNSQPVQKHPPGKMQARPRVRTKVGREERPSSAAPKQPETRNRYNEQLLTGGADLGAQHNTGYCPAASEMNSGSLQNKSEGSETA